MRHRTLVVLVALASVVAVPSASAANPRIYVGPPPKHPTYVFASPGTAAQVVSLVDSSTTLTTVPANVDPPLDVVAGDNINDIAFHTNGGGCSNPSACTYGDVTGTKIVVLFGDSHAWMWLEAINPIITSLGYQLQLLWKPSCAAADLDFTTTPCTTWRTNMMTLIRAEHPALVLMAERTSDITSIGTTQVTAQQWTTSLEKTIRYFQSAAIKVVVIGDTPAYANDENPATCLSQNPTDVQACDTPLKNPNPQWADHEGAEKQAVIDTHAGWINPIQWMCHGQECAPIIGNMVVYLNWSHITATYSEFLSRVMGTRIKAFLPANAP